MKFDPVITAKALKELNAIKRGDGISAAIAYLVGEMPDARDFLNDIGDMMRATGCDVTHEEAASYADTICKSASDLMEMCENHAFELASLDPYDRRSDERREA